MTCFLNHSYNLRPSTLPVVAHSNFEKTHGEWTFNSFFSNFYNKIDINKCIYLISKFDDFINEVNGKIDLIVNKFLITFPKFDILINFPQIYF